MSAVTDAEQVAVDAEKALFDHITADIAGTCEVPGCEKAPRIDARCPNPECDLTMKFCRVHAVLAFLQVCAISTDEHPLNCKGCGIVVTPKNARDRWRVIS